MDKLSNHKNNYGHIIKLSNHQKYYGQYLCTYVLIKEIKAKWIHQKQIQYTKDYIL
jgi:hypothetical protein